MAVTPKQEALMALAPGPELANVAFNLAQHPGYVLTQADCDMLHGLRLQHDAARAALASAIAELVQDAERWQWLRRQTWHESPLCVVKDPKVAVRLGYDCPSMSRLDEAIDAYRGGARSDAKKTKGE
jgi:hypothetical protein